MLEILRFPRTPHLEGSQIQLGDEDMKTISFYEIKDKYLVVTEKMDGSNCGISFDENCDLILQSRKTVLSGGPTEKHFDLLKSWSNTHKNELFDLLGTRYIMYGEWLYAKHTIFYDNLEHYFLEFDIFDREKQQFLSTKIRKQLLKDYPFIHSVKILFEGKVSKIEELISLLGKSSSISQNFMDNLKKICEKISYPYEKAVQETDKSGKVEGIYIKVEDDEKVIHRCKFVRKDFTACVNDSGSHWLTRKIIPNKLRYKLSYF